LQKLILLFFFKFPFRIILFVLIIILFFLPILIYNTSFLEEDLENILFILLSLLIIIIAFPIIVNYSSLNLNFSWSHIISILFILYVTIRCIILKDPSNRYLQFIFLSATLLTLLPFLIKKFRYEYITFLCLLLLLSLQSTLAILQYFQILPYLNPYFKFGGTYINPSVYGNFIAVMISFFIPFLIFKDNIIKSKKLRIILLITVIQSLISVIILLSRTSWIAIIISIAIMLFISTKSRHIQVIKKLNQFSFFLKCLLFTIIIICSIIILRTKTNSTKGRLFIYSRSYSLLNKNLLWGSGLGSFSVLYNLNQASYFQNNPNKYDKIILADNINIAPSDLVQLLIELGLVGLSIILIMLFLLIYNIYKSITTNNSELTNYQIGGLGALISLSICCIFSYPLQITSLVPIYIAIYSIIDIRQKKQNILHINITSFKSYLIALITPFVFFLYISVRKFSAFKDWYAIRTNSSYFNFASEKKRYEHLKRYLGNDYSFIIDLATISMIHGDYEEAIIQFENSNKIFANYLSYMYLAICYESIDKTAQAYYNYKISCNIVPNRFLPKYYLFKFLLKNNRLKEAKQLKTTIISMPIKIPSELVNTVKEEVNKTEIK